MTGPGVCREATPLATLLDELGQRVCLPSNTRLRLPALSLLPGQIPTPLVRVARAVRLIQRSAGLSVTRSLRVAGAATPGPRRPSPASRRLPTPSRARSQSPGPAGRPEASFSQCEPPEVLALDPRRWRLFCANGNERTRNASVRIEKAGVRVGLPAVGGSAQQRRGCRSRRTCSGETHIRN